MFRSFRISGRLLGIDSESCVGMTANLDKVGWKTYRNNHFAPLIACDVRHTHDVG